MLRQLNVVAGDTPTAIQAMPSLINMLENDDSLDQPIVDAFKKLAEFGVLYWSFYLFVLIGLR